MRREKREKRRKNGKIRREKREKRRRMGFEEERRKETVNERMKIKAIFLLITEEWRREKKVHFIR